MNVFTKSLISVGVAVSCASFGAAGADRPARALPAVDPAALASFVHSCAAAKEPCLKYLPSAYGEQTETRLLDLPDILKTSYPSGTAYAASVSKLIDFPFAKVRAFMDQPGALLKFIRAVKTQKEVVELAQAPHEIHIRLAICVPVLPNFHTQDTVTYVETADGRGVMEWAQDGPGGDLTDNRGVVLMQADGERTKIFVLGAHLIKAEHRVPWIGRSTANQFAKDHYANYIEALEKAL